VYAVFLCVHKLLTLLSVQIITRIAGPVLTVTLFSVLVVYASLHGYKLVLTNSIVPLLSVVVRMPVTEQLIIFDIDAFRLALSSSFGEFLVKHYLFFIDVLKQ
jgi:hypothetical protein